MTQAMTQARILHRMTQAQAPGPVPVPPFAAMLRATVVPMVASVPVIVAVFWVTRQSRGGLAALLTCIAEAGGNVVHADHVREAVSLHVRETGVEIALETRGYDHGEAIVEALAAAGYAVQQVGAGVGSPPQITPAQMRLSVP